MKRKSSAALRGSKAAKRHRGNDAGAAASNEKLYTQQDAILVLGDGDFTFSRGLATHRGGGRSLVATSFDSEQKVKAKYSNATECITAVKAAKAVVLHGVDATKLQALPRQAAKQGTVLVPSFFKYIIFNFPHTGQQRVHINRALLLDFFESARPKLEKTGEVHITLKNRPPYSNWQVEDQAKAAGFVLKERHKFNSRLFPGYNHRTTDPQAKTFEAELCTTYVFIVNRSKFPFEAIADAQRDSEEQVSDVEEQDDSDVDEVAEAEGDGIETPVAAVATKSKNSKRKRSKPASKRAKGATASPTPVEESKPTITTLNAGKKRFDGSVSQRGFVMVSNGMASVRLDLPIAIILYGPAERQSSKGSHNFAAPRATQPAATMMQRDGERPRGDSMLSAARGLAPKPKKPSQYEVVETSTPRDGGLLRDTALPASETLDVDLELQLRHSHSDGTDDVGDRIQDEESATASGSESDSAPPPHPTTRVLSHRKHPGHVPCTQIAVVALSAISGFLFGYDLCVMVVALPLIHEAFELSTETAEAVISILMVGAVFGSLAGGVVADRIGRKRAIIVTSVFFLLGSTCMTFANSIYVMLLGRFLAGLAVGASGPCVSTYVAEIADPENRGVLVTVNEVMLCVGCLVSVVVSSSLQNSYNGWRKMLGVTLIPPLVQLAGMPFVPESPRWLLTQKDRVQEAKAVLRRLFPGQDADETDAQIKAQLAMKGHSTSLYTALRHIATDAITRRRVVLSLLVAFAHTLTGANAMLYYSKYIIDSLGAGTVGGTGNAATTASFTGVSKELGVAIAKLAGVCTAIAVVDRVGRRSLLLAGSIVMLGADMVFASCFWGLESGPTQPADETTGIWALYVFIYAWNFSWAPLMWVICSEVLPDDLRSVGMGLTFAVYWLGSSLVNQTLLTIFKLCGMSASFLVYGSLTTAAIAFIYWKVPETRGLSFEEITAQFVNTP